MKDVRIRLRGRDGGWELTCINAEIFEEILGETEKSIGEGSYKRDVISYGGEILGF